MRTLAAWVLCVIGSAALSPAHAVAPDPVNAEFAANPRKIENIALVVDTLIIEDLAGKLGGVSRSDHDSLGPVVGHGVKRVFEARGYRVSELHLNSGLFLPAAAKLEYVDKTGKSTGKSVTYPLHPSNVPEWAQGPVQAVAERVLTKAGPMRSIEVPEEIKALPVDAIAIVVSTSFNLAQGKKIAMGLVGAATGLIGSLITSEAMANSEEGARIMIIDIRDGAVVWLDREPPAANVAGIRYVRHTLVHLLHRLPNRNGSAVTNPADAEAEDVEIESASKPAPESNTARIDFASMPTVFESPAGYSAAELRDAYHARAITPDAYRSLKQNLASKYKEGLHGLKKALRADQITKHEYEVEEHRWNWAYRGFH